MQSCAAGGVHLLAHRMAGHGAPGERRRIGAEARQADLREWFPTCFGQHGRADDGAGLALVRPHGVGGVALGVLDMRKTFLMRAADVIGRHVILDVHEGFSARLHLIERHDALGIVSQIVTTISAGGMGGEKRELRAIAFLGHFLP